MTVQQLTFYIPDILVPGKLVLLGDSAGGLRDPIFGGGTADVATADGSLILVKGALTGHVGGVGVNGALASGSADTLSTTHARVLAASLAVVVELLAGLALRGLTETGVHIGGGGATEGGGGRGLVVR